MWEWLRITAEKPSLQPDILFYLGNFPITSSVITSFVIVLLVLIAGFYLRKKVSLIPSKWQIAVESLYDSTLKLVDQITANRKYSEKIFPLIAALFLYIGIANLISLTPGLTAFSIDGKELFRSPTSDFNTTFALALAMLILVQIESIRDWGVWGYFTRFVQIPQLVNSFKQGIGAGMVGIVNFFIGLLDAVSEVAKVVSLSVRLFGNMYAGEILMIIIMAGFAYFLPAVWVGMSIFVGIVQAIVFGALVAAYYTIAMKGAEEVEKK